MLRARSAAVACGPAVILGGFAGCGDARSSSAQIDGAAGTEVEHGIVEAERGAGGVEARIAVLDGRREMVGAGPARRGGRAEPGFGVAQRSPQRLEQRFLQRPAELRLAQILVAVRDLRDDRGVADCRRGLPALSAPDPAHSLAAL